MLKELWQDLLEMVFPWRCPLCGEEGLPPAGACPPCLASLGIVPDWRCLTCGRPLSGGAGHCPAGAHEHSLDGLIAATEYTSPARRLTHFFKYRGHAPAGRLMAHLLSGAVERCLDIPCDLVVPVPLAQRRQRRRGFNQAALLAGMIGRRLSLPVRYHLLRRVVETGAQVGLDPDRRRDNIGGAFEADGTLIAGRSLLLVDDVYTTGATMNECARTLKGAGAAAVIGAVFACAPLGRDGGAPEDGEDGDAPSPLSSPPQPRERGE